jgi:hypothetical protein
MPQITRVRQIVLLSTRTHWQLIISAVVAALMIPVLSQPQFSRLIEDLRAPATFMTLLGVTGGILALVSIIAHGHLLQFMSAAGNAKSDSYHRLQERLYELDEFVQTHGTESALIDSLLAFSYDLRRLRLRDYPIQDWTERLSPFVNFLTSSTPDNASAFFRSRLVVRLDYIEELVGSIGVASIRQILLMVIARPLLKSLAVLAVLVLVGVFGIVVSGFELAGVLLGVIPIFFAVMSVFLFLEVGLTVYRDIEEVVDFVE